MKLIRLSSLCFLSLVVLLGSCKKDDDEAPACKDADGNVYKTVKIGTQVWMAENLKVTQLNDGTAMTNELNNSDWNDLTDPGYCYYNNDITNKDGYGTLYNYYAVASGKLAPKGWHVPSEAEWQTLITYLGGESVAGGKLKEKGLVHWKDPNTDATNNYGFSAVGGGHRHPSVGFYELNETGFYWTTDVSGSSAICREVSFDNANCVNWTTAKNQGFSVRCVKD
jgi:uncharacterized protein (TIGR02145 family)